MGLLDKLLGRGGSDESTTGGSTPDVVLEDSLDSGVIHGEFQGQRLMFESTRSSNGDWTCLYAQSTAGTDTPIALLDASNKPVHVFGVTRVEDAAVANDGTIAVTDIGTADDQELGGTLTVVNTDGKPLIEHEFDANIWNCAISEDGQYASTATLNPDRSAYIFDTVTGEVLVEYETRDLNGPPQEFGLHEDELVLFLLNDDDRYRGINLDGETVWQTQELERKDEYEQLLESDNIADLQAAVELLEEARESTDDEHELKSLSKKLADTYWELSKKLRKEENDSDRWWESINQAKLNYMDILSRRQGRTGVAKVNRKQSKYYLKEGNEEMAFELLQNIADIEDQYDDDLLTESNKETMERLSD